MSANKIQTATMRSSHQNDIDVPINYVGHAEKWDELEVEGDINSRDCLVRYRRNGRVLAVASIFRDVDNLKEEASMERAGSNEDCLA